MTTINVSVFQASFGDGKQKHVRVRIDGKEVQIPVDESVYAYFHEQFLRKTPTPLQEKRFATVMNVLRAAYLKGVQDGKGSDAKKG